MAMLPLSAPSGSAPGLFQRLMPRRLTLALAAGAVALTGFAVAPAPAQADTDDVVRFLLGAAAVAVIVSAINDNDRPSYISARTLPRECRSEIRLDGRRAEIYGSTCLRRAGYDNLPRRCEVRVRTSRGELRGYEGSCLASLGYGFASGHRPNYRPDYRPDFHPGYRPGYRPAPIPYSEIRRPDRWDGSSRDRGRDRFEQRDRRGVHEELRGRDRDRFGGSDRRIPQSDYYQPAWDRE